MFNGSNVELARAEPSTCNRTAAIRPPGDTSSGCLANDFLSTSILSTRALGANAVRFGAELPKVLSERDRGSGMREQATFADRMAARAEVVERSGRSAR